MKLRAPGLTVASTILIGTLSLGASGSAFAASEAPSATVQFSSSPVDLSQPKDEVKIAPAAILPQTNTQYSGSPDTNYWKRWQCYVSFSVASPYQYNGPVDGSPGTNTWRGIQGYLKNYWGYNGPVDGAPGSNTYAAMQRLAKQEGGYQGPIDGALGPASYRGIATYLNRLTLGCG